VGERGLLLLLKDKGIGCDSDSVEDYFESEVLF